MPDVERRRTTNVALVACGVVFLVLATYVALYFLLGRSYAIQGFVFRVYDSPWLIRFFGPMCWLEHQLGGYSVLLF